MFATADTDRNETAGNELLEDIASIPIFAVVGIGEEVNLTLFSRLPKNSHKSIAVLKGQRPEDGGVHQTEHGRVGTNREGQGNRRDNHEARSLDQRPDCEANVL